MTAWSAMSTGARLAVGLFSGLAVAAVGWVGVTALAPAPDRQPGAALMSERPASAGDTAGSSAENAPAVADTTGAAGGAADGDTAAADLATKEAPEPPAILTWAVTADGGATIAGSAAPGAEVAVMVDGAEVATTKASRGGEFAVVTTLAPNPAPSLMGLVMRIDGAEIASLQQVALGPIAGPVIPPLASAETAAEPAATDPATAAPAAADAPAPSAIMLTEEGSLVLQDPGVQSPGAAQNPGLRIETITYTAKDEVQIGGRAGAGQSLRLYLDNQLVTEAVVAANGTWLATLSDVAPGLYTLRADQIDTDGKVLARVETPFRRETPEALASAAAAVESAAPQAVTAAPAEGSAAAADPGAPLTSDETAVAAATVAQAPNLPDAASAPAPVSVTVQPGHTLWAIAQGELGDGVAYVQVWEANRDKIRDPNLIYPGQVVTIPGR